MCIDFEKIRENIRLRIEKSHSQNLENNMREDMAKILNTQKLVALDVVIACLEEYHNQIQ